MYDVVRFGVVHFEVAVEGAGEEARVVVVEEEGGDGLLVVAEGVEEAAGEDVPHLRDRGKEMCQIKRWNERLVLSKKEISFREDYFL